MSRPGTPRRLGVAAPRLSRAHAAAALLLVAGLMLAGCGSEKKVSKPTPTPSPSASTASPRVAATRTRIAHVAGRLPHAARQRVSAKVGQAVDAWFRAAYLDGAYPRAATTFTQAFPGFTPEAAASARRRLGVMSNAGIARRVDRVVPVTRLVALDLVAAKGRAVGATARVKLVFRTSGSLEAREIVRGQLDLIPATGTWRVFAFDVTKRQVAARSGAEG